MRRNYVEEEGTVKPPISLFSEKHDKTENLLGPLCVYRAVPQASALALRNNAQVHKVAMKPIRHT